MPWIRTISDAEATGSLKRQYEAAIERAGKVYNIVRIQSQNPTVLRSGMALYSDIMKGDSPLTRAQREMMAVVVSSSNGCHY